MRKIINRIFVVLLTFTLLFSEGVYSYALDGQPADSNTGKSSGAVSSGEKILQKTAIADNEAITVYVDENGSFETVDKANGYVWSSCPKTIEENGQTVGINKRYFQSEIVVNFVYKDAFGKTSSYEENSLAGIEAVEKKTVSVYKTDSGVKVVYDFYTICASVALEYSVKDNCLSVAIIGDEVLEGQAFKDKVKEQTSKEQLDSLQESYITSIWLLPSFGAGTKEENGFVFIPDGCGSYMDFNPVSYAAETVSIPFFGREYALDEYQVEPEEFKTVTRPEKAYFPMYAISKASNGIMGIIETGAEISALNAFKAGKANAYTGASARTIYREVSHTLIGGRDVQGISLTEGLFSDFKIDFYFLSNSLSFTNIADNYREILVKENKIQKNLYTPDFNLNVIGAIDVDSDFLGFPCKRLKTLTTYKELGEIISDLRDKEIDSISVNYIGWNNNGVQNKKINDSFNPISKLGGQKQFKKLISLAKEKDAVIYFDSDLQTFKSGGNGISKLENSVKTMFDKIALQRKFSYATFEYAKDGLMLADVKGFSKTFKKYIKSIPRYDESVGLSFNTLSSRLYSNFNNENPTTKSDLLNAYEKSIDSVKNSLSAKDAFSYAWEYADKIFEAPMASSRQRIYDGEVPMYQMILHGYIPFTTSPINSNANSREMFLRAVETGSELCFTVMHENSETVNGTDYDYLYGTTYSEVVSEAVHMYNEYNELLKTISDATIQNYQYLKNDVSKTTYSNGVEVIVNYSNEEYLADGGIIVPANGFWYGR